MDEVGHGDQCGAAVAEDADAVDPGGSDQRAAGLVEDLECLVDAAVGIDQPGREPRQAQQPVESHGARIVVASLGVVDAGEAVDLHQPVPEPPGHQDHHHPLLEFCEQQRQRCSQQQQRHHGEADAESAEESPVAVGTHQARQVVPGGSEGGHKAIDRVRRETQTRQPQHRQDHQRGGDEQQQVPGGSDDPPGPSGPVGGSRGRHVTLGQLLAHRFAPGRTPPSGEEVCGAVNRGVRPEAAGVSIRAIGGVCEEPGDSAARPQEPPAGQGMP